MEANVGVNEAWTNGVQSPSDGPNPVHVEPHSSEWNTAGHNVSTLLHRNRKEITSLPATCNSL